MITQFLLFILSFYSYTIAPKTMDRWFMGGMLIIAFLSILNCYFRKDKNPNLRRQYLRHSFIFLIGYIIVFYQYIIDYVTHYIEKPDDVESLIWYSQDVVCRALCLANVGLNSFLLGYLYVKMKYKNVHIKRTTNIRLGFRNVDVLFYISLLLIIVYVVSINKTYLFNGYGKNAQMGEIAFHVGIWLQGILTAYVAIVSFQIKNKNKRLSSIGGYLRRFKKPLILCLIMTILILMSGRRTEALRYLLLLTISYLYIGNIKLSPIKLLIPVIIIAALFSVLALVRTNNNISIRESLSQMSEYKTLSPATQELAFNISSLHIALASVPKYFPFLYGLPTLIGISVIIPGLQPFLISKLSIPDIFLNSGNLICYAALGEIRYYSLGTSLLADAYINFGLYGIVLIPLMLGIALRWIEDQTFSNKTNSIYALGISFCFYTNLIYLCRGTITSPLASISYVIILIFIMTYRVKESTNHIVTIKESSN